MSKKKSKKTSTVKGFKKYWKLIIGILLVIGGFGNIGENLGAVITGILIGGAFIVWHFMAHKGRKEEITRATVDIPLAEKTMEITNEVGEKEIISKREIFFGEFVLITDGGNTFHTHADCVENWKPTMRASFSGWKKISKLEAQQKGLRYCRFCEDYYENLTSDDYEEGCDEDYYEDDDF